MDRSQFFHPNDQLRQERIQRNWRQQEVADQLGTTVVTVNRWERGRQKPTAYFRAKLCALFGKSVQELGFLSEEAQQHENLGRDATASVKSLTPSFSSNTPHAWGIPYPRNPFFVGREDILQQLHATLTYENATLLSHSYTLSGLGGIGKTQTVIEYAYRYANDYTTIFWINAETYESIVSSIITIAILLNLPEKQEQEREKIVATVIRWFSNHRHWLLIIDNVEDPVLVKRILPPARYGAILFTSRRQSLGLTAHILNLEPMLPEEGIRFLLYRAGLFDPIVLPHSLPPEKVSTAQEIVKIMDGLPLALDQAGAYIEAAQCSLSDYLQLFQASQLRLLNERDHWADHPLSVTKTFALVFEYLEQNNPSAIGILTACAFLAPEAIPETLFIEGNAYSMPTLRVFRNDHFQFNAALKALLSYSLIQRNITTHTITIHRLVQIVLRERIDDTIQRQWVEQTVQALNHMFPDGDDLPKWPDCQLYLSHVLICAQLISQWEITTTHAVRLLHQSGIYLLERAHYTQAEMLIRKALDMAIQMRGAGHIETVKSLTSLARLNRICGRYEQAESLYQEALAIYEQHLGVEHPDVGYCLNGLGLLSFNQGYYEKAELFLQRTLTIYERHLGVEHLKTGYCLNDLALLYSNQGHYERAEPLYRRTLTIYEQHLGPEHPETALSTSNLARLYIELGRYREAESLCQRAVAIYEQHLGPEHPETAQPLSILARLYIELGRYREAESLCQRAVAIYKQYLGAEHIYTAGSLSNLAKVYTCQGKYKQAESLLLHALEIWKQKVPEQENPRIAQIIINLAELYFEQDRDIEAKSLFQHSLQISMNALRSDHPRIADSLTGLAKIYIRQAHYNQAESLFQQAKRIREQAWGQEHPLTLETLQGLAQLYTHQGKYETARLFLQQALLLYQRYLGQRHPKIAEILRQFAILHQAQQQTTEALALYQQALTIFEQALGSNHPKTRGIQADCTSLLNKLGQINETEQLVISPRLEIHGSNVLNNAEIDVEQCRDTYPPCPNCQQKNAVVRSGVNRSGTHRFRCGSCQRYFSPNAKKRGYDISFKTQVLALARTGISSRIIAQRFNIHHSTISLWIKDDLKQGSDQ